MKINLGTLKFKLKLKPKHRKKISHLSKLLFWFFLGGFLSLFFIISFGFIGYQKLYQNKIYPGISVNGTNLGGKTEKQAENFFDSKNVKTENTNFVLTSTYGNATISAKEIKFGLDSKLLSNQAYSLGRSDSILSNITIIIDSYLYGINLSSSYKFDKKTLETLLSPISEKIEKPAVNALFNFENGKVTAFRLSQNGQIIDFDELDKKISDKSLTVASSLKNDKIVIIPIPIKVILPEITTEKVNKYGIKELIGEGHSLFYHSIAGRIYNVNLAASRVNGILVAPGETFSFDKALGDVSSFTGYQQAYIIQNGKTVLGDGGGVCQVSTTFFRALLDAGLPIVERHAHAYRVGYYEEDSPPGIDATVYVPTVDLKFKNDTGNYILIQSQIDLNNLSLSYYLYGVKDGRSVSMTTPVITNQTPAPPDLYQDDPTLPLGTIKQVDFAAAGASVYFTRTVTKNGSTIISDKFVSNYQPWQAIYLKGTRQ